jgi:hypothetical protein
MSTDAYAEIVHRLTELTPDEQQSLLRELAKIVSIPPPTSRARSILELQGLGKEIWKDIDVEKYIEQERSSWDG